MEFAHSIDVNTWDWFWAWYPIKRTFVDLKELLLANEIRFSGSSCDVTDDYIACHRILMEVASVANPGESAFSTSAKVRANRWRPMLLSELEYDTLHFPVVSCLEFMNINLLSVPADKRVKIVEAITLALNAEPKWSWGEGHRIWWCVDGAQPGRLEYFRSI